MRVGGSSGLGEFLCWVDEVLTPQVWLCGGSMEVLPCSRVAHIERKKKPYNSNIGFYTKRNALRVAEVWMDDYKSHVYIAWNLPLEVEPSPSPRTLTLCLTTGH